MKQVKFVVHEPSVNKVVGSELVLVLNDDANVVDTINEVDKLINIKDKRFPLPDYQSLLHMVYNPVAGEFYKQVAIAAHMESGEMLNIRGDPKKQLPEGITVILIPAGGCISEWEEAISPQEFLKAIHNPQQT
jgi:hypothetical protein